MQLYNKWMMTIKHFEYASFAHYGFKLLLLEYTSLLHYLECIESPGVLFPCQNDPTEATPSNDFDLFEVLLADLLYRFFVPQLYF
jgi:hypothetical protein